MNNNINIIILYFLKIEMKKYFLGFGSNIQFK